MVDENRGRAVGTVFDDLIEVVAGEQRPARVARQIDREPAGIQIDAAPAYRKLASGPP